MSTKQMAQLLADELNNYQTLKQILLEEQKELSHYNRDALEELQKAKPKLLVAIQASGQKRSELLRQLGYSNDSHGLEALINKIPATVEQLAPLWQQLKQLHQECHEINLANGKILQRTQQTVQRFLSIYRGQEPNAGNLYNQTGQLAKGSAGLCVSQA